MMLLRLTSPDAVRGIQSDDDFTIGRFTHAGTYNLLVLGAAIGITGAAVYQWVRPWLPGPWWFRRLTVALGSGVVVGIDARTCRRHRLHGAEAHVVGHRAVHRATGAVRAGDRPRCRSKRATGVLEQTRMEATGLADRAGRSVPADAVRPGRGGGRSRRVADDP